MDKIDPLQEDRFRFIDFLLLFKGGFTRAELVERFSIGEATASRSIASFLEVYPQAVEYLGPRKGYAALKGFSPRFEHRAENGLLYVMSGKITQAFEVKSYGAPIYSLQKALEVKPVAAITRAIVNQREASIQYVSTTSGAKSRSVAPHAIFYAGGSWYFRAFDQNSHEFRTFKFSRLPVAVEMGKVESQKWLGGRDDAWNRMRIVQLVPHPKNPLPDALWQDLGVKDSETKELTVSEACLGFVLTDLRVDCSKGSRLNCHQYPLALKNLDELKEIDSLIFAPGFKTTN